MDKDIILYNRMIVMVEESVDDGGGSL